jgi:hypothetical protein
MSSEVWGREFQRSRCHEHLGSIDRGEQGGDVEASVRGRVRAESACRLLELALATDLLPATGLIPGNRDVDEALQEISLGRLGSPPGVLELLVRLEVPAFANQLKPALVAGSQAAKLAHFAAATDMRGCGRFRS